MKTKLMISALLFCSSLSFAADAPSRAAPAPEKKKPSKMIAPASTDSAQKVDETVFGGLGTRGTGAPPQKREKPRK